MVQRILMSSIQFSRCVLHSYAFVTINGPALVLSPVPKAHALFRFPQLPTALLPGPPAHITCLGPPGCDRFSDFPGIGWLAVWGALCRTPLNWHWSGVFLVIRRGLGFGAEDHRGKALLTGSHQHGWCDHGRLAVFSAALWEDVPMWVRTGGGVLHLGGGRGLHT